MGRARGLGASVGCLPLYPSLDGCPQGLWVLQCPGWVMAMMPWQLS